MKSPVERLAETHPDLEIWWDSAPLIFENWVRGMLAAASPRRRPVLEEQLRRLYVAEDPARSVFRGCTTNPPFSLKAVQSDPGFWDAWVDDLIRTHPGMGREELSWLTYKEVVRRGAEMYLPMFEASDCRYGWLSAQLDPRLSTEKEVMIRQAEELHAIHPNVMVKVPATEEGIDVLRMLTGRGISTNATVCFTLPQMIAAARAVSEGMELARQDGVDLTRWRSVVTMMVGRLTEREALLEQARWRGIELSWQDVHWFGIAVFRRAYRIFQDRGYPAKLLACSLRPGPLVAGKQRFWDLEKMAGGGIIITLAPYALEPLFAIGDGLIFSAEIDEEVPGEVLEKMSRIPYCIQAYDPNGLSPDQFGAHPSTRYMLGEFSKAASGLEEYVGQR
ncbi:MAG: transaldolase family protein, partial [Anaerolineae bacterium]|nr:transaldolase family protein [Anaerolineae bacterium]